ncbi:MAG: hypothetical protein J0I99_00510 [Devosia sp.]|uniref:hypothetical protein n=1 Tax=Devosia sp. TaxID=1871048 RepID=UPI001AC18624|nr:hypothetical protein [Devosia sp.]MBN9310845.1 hypothetical protein [Devosia sp.]MBN9314198.1 hypothetical protein [Devosia sp.]
MKTLAARLRVAAARRLNILYLRLRYVLRPTYVVIYDVDVGGEAREEWYGYFSSPEEARRLFTDAFGDNEAVGNAHLAIKLHALPSRQLEI